MVDSKVARKILRYSFYDSIDANIYAAIHNIYLYLRRYVIAFYTINYTV